MDVECVFFGPVRETVGTKETTRTVAQGTTIADLIETLVAEYDGLRDVLLTDDGDLRETLVVTVNKQHIRYLDGESTALSDGDTVRITTSVQGGS